MHQPKYQIFVSSTFEDLRDERAEVIRSILELRHIPVGMEMFSAADEEQWKIIAAHIAASDYYVVLVAHRYGTLTPDGISYTRKEYEYALHCGVPILGFIVDEAADWPAGHVDKATKTLRLLKAFRELVRQKPVGTWTNAGDLAAKCTIALSKAFADTPRTGWLPADQVAGPETTAELSRLSSENALLRSKIESSYSWPDSGPNDLHDRMAERLSQCDTLLSYRPKNGDDWKDVDPAMSLRDVFDLVAERLMIEVSIEVMANWLAFNVTLDQSAKVATNQVQFVMADLAALGLVAPSQKKHGVNDEDEYWTLTDFGRDLTHGFRLQALDEAATKKAATAATKKAATK